MKAIIFIKEKGIFMSFYWAIRVSMGITFIISGLRKLYGNKFTLLTIDNPVGSYFDAMHEMVFYWNFIGYFQIANGILLFFNRFVVLSSLLMMPVTVNIFLISITLNMKGTPFITAALVLGNIFLMMWNYDNYKAILRKPL